MNAPRFKQFSSKLMVGSIGLLVLLGVGDRLLSPIALAMPISNLVATMDFRPPPPPPDRNTPGSRGGAAGRQRGCGAGTQAVTALVPEYQQQLGQTEMTKVWGTTITDHPTFWFDLPYEQGTIASMEFVLQDGSSPAKDLYRAEIAPPTAPGIIRVHLPTTVPPLETGKLYQWFFKVRLQCGGSEVAKSHRQKQDTVWGWMQRVSPDASLSQQLQQATPQQQAVIYAQQGIWFDALTTLAELRLSRPQDPGLIEDWQRLLHTVDLGAVAKNPLLPCCQTQSTSP